MIGGAIGRLAGGGYNGIDGKHEIDSMEVMVDMERAHLELGADGIRVVPALADKSEIEGKALRFLLRNLGDAASIEVQRIDEAWHVMVYSSAGTTPIGRLVYDSAGELLNAWKILGNQGLVVWLP